MSRNVFVVLMVLVALIGVAGCAGMPKQGEKHYRYRVEPDHVERPGVSVQVVCTPLTCKKPMTLFSTTREFIAFQLNIKNKTQRTLVQAPARPMMVYGGKVYTPMAARELAQAAQQLGDEQKRKDWSGMKMFDSNTEIYPNVASTEAHLAFNLSPDQAVNAELRIVDFVTNMDDLGNVTAKENLTFKVVREE